MTQTFSQNDVPELLHFPRHPPRSLPYRSARLTMPAQHAYSTPAAGRHRAAHRDFSLVTEELSSKRGAATCCTHLLVTRTCAHAARERSPRVPVAWQPGALPLPATVDVGKM